MSGRTREEALECAVEKFKVPKEKIKLTQGMRCTLGDAGRHGNWWVAFPIVIVVAA